MQDKIQTQAQIKDLRKQIDQINQNILQNLDKRSKLVKEIGILKKQLGQETIVPNREQEILDQCQTPLQRAVMQKIIEESRKIQD